MNTNNLPGMSSGRGGLQGVMDNGQLVWRLLQDDRVPTPLKVAIPLGVAVYFIMPLDLIPDFIPLLGQLDDLGVVLLGMTLLINMAPRAVVNEHRAALGMDLLLPKSRAPLPRKAGSKTVIDTTYETNNGERRV